MSNPLTRLSSSNYKNGGIEISAGQLNNILIENKEIFHSEQQQVLRVGLETAAYVHTDDTGARHQGKNGYCTVIGNQWFAYFKSSRSKSRQNFLETLQGGGLRYVLNDDAQAYLESQPASGKVSRTVNLFGRQFWHRTRRRGQPIC